MDQSAAKDALKELEPLVGEWTMTATPPGGEPWPGEPHLVAVRRDVGEQRQLQPGVSVHLGCRLRRADGPRYPERERRLLAGFALTVSRRKRRAPSGARLTSADPGPGPQT